MESAYLKAIPQIEEKEFNRISSILREIGEEERHFNNLTSRYKTLASTWLLSTFGGIGFILINDIQPLFLLVAGIGFAGGIGIYLLWLMDLKVYQQLLNANFTEGYKLELEYPWLPRIRENMIKSQITGTVIGNLSWFYILGVVVPLLIGALSLSKYLLPISWICTLVTAIGFSFFLPFLSRRMITESEEKNLKEYLEKHKRLPISIKTVFWWYGWILLIGFAVFHIPTLTDILYEQPNSPMQTIPLKEQYDYLAPDQSEIRMLPQMQHGGMAHCRLPAGSTTKAVVHKTVEEIWYVLEGRGEIWRADENSSSIEILKPGISISIPIGTKFQFRNTGDTPLDIIIATMPPWPGADEAEPVEGYW